MPGLWAHSLYWQNDNPSTVADPVRPVTGYPGWQSGVILGGGLGAVQLAFERLTLRRESRKKE
jgi:hypothetical protein